MSKIIQSAYNLIESQKYKKAAEHLDSPEVARYPLAKSLKCYCYVRLGNHIKVREGIEEFIALKSNDTNMVKQVMDAIHYIGDYSLAVRLLEEAHKKDKHNIEFGELLYYAYFWTKQFDKMRDLALDLVKLYKMDKYSIWNYVNVLYNTNPEDPAKYKMVMLIAERMIQRQLKNYPITSREGRCYQWLLMEIYIREGKFEEAEKELEDRMANYVASQRLLDERILQRMVLRELNRETEIVSCLEEDMLKGLKSDWDAIHYYVDTLFELFAKEEALKRLVAFKEQFCGDLSKREQWFVQFEAASRSSDKTELVDCIKKYCSFIGHKQCCYADLERWLPLVKEDEAAIQEITVYLMSVLNLTVFVVKGDDLLKVVQQKITAIQISIALEIPVNESFLKELYKIYTMMIPQYNETLESKEILAFDYIPYLIAIILHNRALREPSIPERFFCECEAIALLQEHVSRRPHFFLSTVALFLLSYQLGEPLECFHHYHQLNIKEIQMMSLCYLTEQVCREWSILKETRDSFTELNLFLYDGLKESAKKEVMCLDEGTFVNMRTIHDLNTRLHNSRECETFKVLFYLNSLAESLKDPSHMNHVCFDEFVLPLSLSDRRDNADRKIIRDIKLEGTQLHQLMEKDAVAELSGFEEAVCRFFYQFRLNNSQFEKVEGEVVNAVVEKLEVLKAKMQSVSVYSYCIVGEIVKMLQAKEIGETEKRVDAWIACIQKELEGKKEESVYSAAMLNQVNQMMNRSAVWLILLLPKNKKCSKPSPAKEPMSGVIVSTLMKMCELAVLRMPEKKDYAAVLEKQKLLQGRFVSSVSAVSTEICSNHIKTISQINAMVKDIQGELKKKNYRLKSNSSVC